VTNLADMGAVARRARAALRPPLELSLSEWADREFVLWAEVSAETGRWHTLPYQRGIMDAITDPATEKVSVMKSARVGYTLMISAAIAYHIDHDPTSMLVVQPTVDDAKGFSKETIAPMLQTVPALSRVAFRDEDVGRKDNSNTLTHKKFPGGVLSLTGANSGTGFRRITRRVVIMDEVDAYPPSAGGREGDPYDLARKRNETFWNRKTIAGSTPLTAGHSRISELFEAGDQRRYYVPCPQCGHMDFLSFREQERGHFMRWPDGKPGEAFFVCRKTGCVIEHQQKRDMVAAGEWRSEEPFRGHASFHVWAAYSFSPNATWGQLAEEFVEAKKGGPEKLKTFVNTVLGETWVEKGEAPDWQRIYLRRESYPIATVPVKALLLTAGVDVQRDRLVWEVVAWGDDKASWSVDAGVIPGDTSKEGADGPWPKLDELLDRTWPGPEDAEYRIRLQHADGLQLGARQADESRHRLQGRLDGEDPHRLPFAGRRDRAREEDGQGLQGLAGGDRHCQV
jgi:phage terminase large subunit GpA-like protein